MKCLQRKLTQPLKFDDNLNVKFKKKNAMKAKF